MIPDVGRLTDTSDWAVCGAIAAVAITGKLGACTAAARFSGLAPRDAVTIGALMNARGLMELVVLNIGYDLGILTPKLFAMFVLMAVGTTCMAGPLALTGSDRIGSQEAGSHTSGRQMGTTAR